MNDRSSTAGNGAAELAGDTAQAGEAAAPPRLAMVVQFVDKDGILKFVAANPGFVVGCDLGWHSAHSILMEFRP